jgi:ketosteroid isomerase-like protein
MERSAREVVERFWAAMGRNDWRAAAAELDDDFELVWPQSGERIRGRENFVAVNGNYPAAGPWRFTVHRIVAEGQGAASEVGVTDGKITARAVTFFELRNGRVRTITEFWPEPFPPAGWRARWVEVPGGGI